MSDLGLADRYVDFLQGRAKRSMLSRHYSDFSVEKMKARYDRCGLKILAECAKNLGVQLHRKRIDVCSNSDTIDGSSGI